MPPWLRDATKRCLACGNPATLELLNERNASMGYYCKRDGRTALEAAVKDFERRYVADGKAGDVSRE